MFEPLYCNEYLYTGSKYIKKVNIIDPITMANLQSINMNNQEKTEENINENINGNIEETIKENKNINQYVLNPLTVIIKLSILSCKPIGTKIHIQNNIIYFQEPGIFQGITRYIYKSNKSQLQYLYDPIKLACQYYLTKEYIKKTPNIVNIFNSAKNGIENLIKTYSACSITVLCLKYYHVIINNYIKQTTNEYIYKEVISNKDIEYFYTKELLDKFHQQWNTSKLKIVLDLMDFLLNHDLKENKTNNIKSLETIVNNNDEDTQKILIESI
jgi:hypothetical protein